MSAGDWGVSGAAPVDEHFRSAPWVPLVRGLPSADEARAWLRAWIARPGWRRHALSRVEGGQELEPELVHYMVHTGPADRPGEWEAWYWRGDTCEVVSAKDGRPLCCSTNK